MKWFKEITDACERKEWDLESRELGFIENGKLMGVAVATLDNGCWEAENELASGEAVEIDDADGWEVCDNTELHNGLNLILGTENLLDSLHMVIRTRMWQDVEIKHAEMLIEG